jgi:hypothetical protein
MVCDGVTDQWLDMTRNAPFIDGNCRRPLRTTKACCDQPGAGSLKISIAKLANGQRRRTFHLLSPRITALSRHSDDVFRLGARLLDRERPIWANLVPLRRLARPHPHLNDEDLFAGGVDAHAESRRAATPDKEVC